MKRSRRLTCNYVCGRCSRRCRLRHPVFPCLLRRLRRPRCPANIGRIVAILMRSICHRYSCSPPSLFLPFSPFSALNCIFYFWFFRKFFCLHFDFFSFSFQFLFALFPFLPPSSPLPSSTACVANSLCAGYR